MTARRLALDAGVASLHARADAAWRHPAAAAVQWANAGAIDERLLRHVVHGAFWEALAAERVTLLVTREYEHLVLALHAGTRGPRISYLPLPHPSGLAVDRRRGVVHVASTRNPNQIFDLVPARSWRPATGGGARPLADRPLVPRRVRFLPGGTYLHDLALVGGRLHANAVGRNAIVRLEPDGRAVRVWWPRCISGSLFDRNYLQLNSIAAGRTLRRSFFSASTDVPSARRPGHQNFPVDGRGVVFSGATRAPIVRGLTRPHSARLHGAQLWVANSGYGEIGVCADGRLTPVARPGGWTRGVAFAGDTLFAGTSRVLPRFAHYAPGLEPARCAAGVHALDPRSGRVLGSLVWPFGNQVFAIEAVPDSLTRGLPLVAGQPAARAQRLFYGFTTGDEEDGGR
ncbi:MAG TPA: DUF4915 domain-containing protein [Candidatus Binatia bacterium]|nr:DUF4915 domain-containing protein [Candidatus Binatia bacterium]